MGDRSIHPSPASVVYPNYTQTRPTHIEMDMDMDMDKDMGHGQAILTSEQGHERPPRQQTARTTKYITKDSCSQQNIESESFAAWHVLEVGYSSTAVQYSTLTTPIQNKHCCNTEHLGHLREVGSALVERVEQRDESRTPKAVVLVGVAPREVRVTLPEAQTPRKHQTCVLYVRCGGAHETIL